MNLLLTRSLVLLCTLLGLAAAQNFPPLFSDAVVSVNIPELEDEDPSE